MCARARNMSCAARKQPAPLCTRVHGCVRVRVDTCTSYAPRDSDCIVLCISKREPISAHNVVYRYLSIYLKIQTLVSVYTLKHVRVRVSSHAFIYVRMHQSEQISTLFCRSSYMLICVCNEATSARSYICSCISHFCVCACVCVSKCTKTSSVPHLPNHSMGDPPAL